MAIMIKYSATKVAAKFNALAEIHPTVQAAVKPKKSGHTQARPIGNIDFDKPGRLRVGHLMTVFRISHSGFYQRLKRGEIPPPDGYYPGITRQRHPSKKPRRTPFWFTSTIAPLLGVKS